MLTKQNTDLHIIMTSKEKFNQKLWVTMNFISSIFIFRQLLLKYLAKSKKGKP